MLVRGESWLDELDRTGNLESDYMRGLYWSVSIMFSGSSFLPPTNISEAIFAALCISVSALFVTSITSNLAAILIESQEAQHEMKKKVRALNTFMDQRGTSPLLAIAVRTDFLAQMACPARVTELDIPMLDAIRKDLRCKLRHEQFGPAFSKISFMRVLEILNKDVVNELCTTLMVVVSRDGDELFSPNEGVSYAILVNNGHLKYEPMRASLRLTAGPDPTTSVMRCVPEQVPLNSWVCELCLFLQWKTCGGLTSASQTEMLYLSTETYIKVVTSDPLSAALAAHYSVQYATTLESESCEPSDLDPGLDEDRVLAGTHMTIRELISMPLWEQLRRQQSVIAGLIWKKSMYDLRSEIQHGRSFLAMGTNSEIYRVARVVVLRIMDRSGNLCVELLDTDLGPCVHRLPGGKVQMNETAAEALQRILVADLQEIAPYIRFEPLTKVVEEYRPSDTYAVPT
eukprot:481070-Amphidinium_carterae.1